MRIRTQLILASFFLAVLPLAAIVTYSYRSSRRAVESTERRETQRMAQQMDRRLASIRTDLEQRIELVSALPVTDAGSSDVGNTIAAAMSDEESLVEGLEFKPLPVPPAKVVMMHEAAPSKEAPPAPHPGGPMLIDLPTAPLIPRFVMSEEQRELLDEVASLGAQMGDASLSADEREDIRRELDATQKKLHDVIAKETQRIRARPVPRPAAAPAPTPVAASAAAVAPRVIVRGLSDVEAERVRMAERKAALILGKKYKASVRKEGEIVGQLTPSINPDRVIQRVLGASEDRDEIPFAVDREGTLYARNDNDRKLLESSGIASRVKSGQNPHVPGWIVSTSTDQQSGLRIGVARQVGENLAELRRTAANNFVLGLGLIVFAMIGIVPLSNHLTRDVKVVTEGAERIAQGDLMTRLPVKSKNELGQLARAFNQMAEDLSLHQEKLVDQERMAVEYERKSDELEEARRFQLSMLPKTVPQHDGYDVAVYTRTATEVGGDYYDFHVASGGTLSVTIGDATGHGAKAGTMVTVIKALFAGYDGEASPAAFLRDAAERIKRMELGRMSMALSLARLETGRLTLASAGMPPVLVHRASRDEVEEISLGATPLGTLGMEYHETTFDVASGDTLLFLTDGFPELMNDAGQQYGYAATLDAFAIAAREKTAGGVIASLTECVREWHGDAPPNDDVTFVVARVV
jgi:serine phosphatase RsbU (regulator of sigma subunit)